MPCTPYDFRQRQVWGEGSAWQLVLGWQLLIRLPALLRILHVCRELCKDSRSAMHPECVAGADAGGEVRQLLTGTVSSHAMGCTCGGLCQDSC